MIRSFCIPHSWIYKINDMCTCLIDILLLANMYFGSKGKLFFFFLSCKGKLIWINRKYNLTIYIYIYYLKVIYSKFLDKMLPCFQRNTYSSSKSNQEQSWGNIHFSDFLYFSFRLLYAFYNFSFFRIQPPCCLYPLYNPTIAASTCITFHLIL